MPTPKDTYWKFFNNLGRFVGVCFVVLGGGLFIWTLTQGDWLLICITALGPIFGILLLCAKPIQPDLPDSDATDSSKRLDKGHADDDA